MSGTFGEGVSLEEVSLGGNCGTAIIGSQSLIGALRIIALTLGGAAFLEPYLTGQLS